MILVSKLYILVILILRRLIIMRNVLKGENIKLTSIRKEDIPLMEEWYNDVEFLRYYDMVPAMPRSGVQIEKMVDEHYNSTDKCMFAVRINEADKIIGVTGFNDIIWSNGTAMFYIGIGDKFYTSKGIGKEVMALMLDFGFNELNFHRIHLSVISYNERAIKLYESFGFIREGTYREFIKRDGKRYDLHLYGLLRTEWENLLPRRG